MKRALNIIILVSLIFTSCNKDSIDFLDGDVVDDEKEFDIELFFGTLGETESREMQFANDCVYEITRSSGQANVEITNGYETFKIGTKKQISFKSRRKYRIYVTDDNVEKNTVKIRFKRRDFETIYQNTNHFKVDRFEVVDNFAFDLSEMKEVAIDEQKGLYFVSTEYSLYCLKYSESQNRMELLSSINFLCPIIDFAVAEKENDLFIVFDDTVREEIVLDIYNYDSNGNITYYGFVSNPVRLIPDNSMVEKLNSKGYRVSEIILSPNNDYVHMSIAPYSHQITGDIFLTLRYNNSLISYSSHIDGMRYTENILISDDGSFVQYNEGDDVLKFPYDSSTGILSNTDYTYTYSTSYVNTFTSSGNITCLLHDKGLSAFYDIENYHTDRIVANKHIFGEAKGVSCSPDHDYWFVCSNDQELGGLCTILNKNFETVGYFDNSMEEAYRLADGVQKIFTSNDGLYTHIFCNKYIVSLKRLY